MEQMRAFAWGRMEEKVRERPGMDGVLVDLVKKGMGRHGEAIIRGSGERENNEGETDERGK